MPALLFHFKDLVQEVRAITQMAGEFLEPASSPVLTDYASALEQIQDHRSERMVRWEIKRERPVRTIPSRAYERSGKAKHPVFGQISSVWQIAPQRPSGKKKQAGKKNQVWATCALVGIASTQVSLHRLEDNGDSQEISMWRMEIADDQAPGCTFHVQVLGKDESIPFPKFISVPRLPALPITAAAALEYVIGELFQDDWRVHGLKETYLSQQWRLIQAHRLERFLDWQIREVRKPQATGSPWVRLKTLPPEAEMFLAK